MRKVCVVTGTRADYGLLYWTMKEIEKSDLLQLQLVVTGMHLSSKFGETWKNIESDGFKINYKVDLGELAETRASILNQISVGIVGFSKAFEELKPNLVLILGDRYEMLAVAQTAMLLGIPIAHIHGGEVTEGAFDDQIRHAITKMSNLHFASTESYRQRVIQLGESPDTVFHVGAPGLENFLKLSLLSKVELERSLDYKLKEKNLLITYHPVTAVEENGIDELISALEQLPDVGQIVTLPNSDPGHDEIFRKWNAYAKDRKNVYLTTSLGQMRYLSAMKICDAVVGNSSSGIIEAPFCGTSTVNIGLRQKGRIQSPSIYNVVAHRGAIYDILSEIIERKHSVSYVYGDGKTSHRIVDVLVKANVVNKIFYDLEFEC